MDLNQFNIPKIIIIALFVYLLSNMISVVSMSINIYFAPPEMSRISLITLGLLIFGLMLALGYQIFLGKNWARIVLACFTIYSFVAELIEPTQPFHSTVIYLNWIIYFFSFISIVMLFLTPSNQWFREKAKYISEIKQENTFKKDIVNANPYIKQTSTGTKIVYGIAIYLLLAFVYVVIRDNTNILG